MTALINEIGNRHGRLVVVERADDVKGRTSWNCMCDCGKSHVVVGTLLRNGTVRSCGCLRADLPPGNATHMMSSPGKKYHRLFQNWMGMKNRCTNQNEPAYPNYGGRGITVCDEWQKFEPFMEWAIKNGYRDDLTIDRKNNDGNYEPGNCQFITLEQNQRNRRNNRRITYKGNTRILVEWAELLGISGRALQRRVALGWSIEKAFTKPIHDMSGAGRKPKPLNFVSPDSFEGE